MNSNGSGQTLLTNHPAEDYLPNWGAPGPIVPPPPVAYRALVPVALAQ